MDSVIASVIVLLWIILNIGTSSQKYCDVSQTSQGGWMQCYAVNNEELISDLSGNISFTVFTIELGDVPEMPFNFTWRSQGYLHMLRIRHSGLKTINDNAWVKFPDIAKIDFSHNQIHKIGKNYFQGLYQLKELYLNSNGIAEIEHTAFDDLRSLQKLNLSSNILTKLDIRLQSSLTSLSISHNPLQQISRDVLRNADNLEQLEIDNINLLTVLELLQMLPTNLTSLSMTKTYVSKLNATTFGHYDRLRRLWITSNSIDQIDDNAFSNLPNLAVIFASRNNLEAIPKALGTLKSLLYLDLSYNHISVFDDDLLSSFAQLTHLDLSNNPVVYEKSTPIKKMNVLKYLSLEKIGMNQESGLLELFQESLTNIILAHNKITAVTSTMFIFSDALEKLDLSYNLINRIDEGSLSKTSRLKELYLQGNKLTEISPRLFVRTLSLENLDLSDNNIQEIPVEVFDKLSNLTSLNLSYNHNINELHGETFSKTSQLKDLYLQGNKINSIPSQLFLNTSLLEHLDVSNNQLQEISIGAFDNLHNLIYLNLSLNRLKMLDEFHLYALRNLQQLYLHGNHLRTVSGLDSLTSIGKVTLENNNWHCDSLLKNVKILRSKYVRLGHAYVRNVTSHLKGIPCSHVSEDKLSDKKNQHEESSGVNIGYINVALLGIILLLICCICAVKIYKKILKKQQVNMYRPRQYLNDYKDVVKVEEERKTTSTVLDEKNSLYNCYEVVQ